MKRTLTIGFIFAVCFAAVLWLPKRSPKNSELIEMDSAPAMAPTHTSPGNSNSAALLGEEILRDYGTERTTPEQDLTLVARLMENSLILLKSAANRPLSANEDWADLLRGRNAASERFLPDTHPALNQQGQLVDRWHSPLFFHAVGGGRYELRSAGPDRKLWTADDLHRNPDGSFRRGAALNPPALYPTQR